MTKSKTQPNDLDPEVFLNQIEDEQVRQDSFALLRLFKSATGEEPQMWGDSIVGFGRYRYRYASGREGEWPLTGFSPRKQNLTLYITSGFDQYGQLLARIGKHKTGKSCLYIKRLADVDPDVLQELVERSVAHMRETNPPA